MSDFVTPFRPGSALIRMVASTAAPSGTLVGVSGDWTSLIGNESQSADAWLAYGPTSAVVSGALIPVVGAPMPPNNTANFLFLPARTVQAFTFSGPTFFGGQTNNGQAAILDLVVGDGT